MRKIFLCLAGILYVSVACAQMPKPPEIADDIKSIEPYGEGTYRQLLVNSYDASLWTDAHPWSMHQDFALSLRYRMHFTTQEIVQRSIDEMQHINPLPASAAADYTAQLTKLIPEVKEGDVITALYTPGKNLTFYYNGKITGKIQDDTFAQRFLGIWLSEKTSAPELRKQLLKGQISF